MIVYLDYLFIENVIFDFIILKEVALASKIKYQNKNMHSKMFGVHIFIIILMPLKLSVLLYLR